MSAYPLQFRRSSQKVVRKQPELKVIQINLSEGNVKAKDGFVEDSMPFPEPNNLKWKLAGFLNSSGSTAGILRPTTHLDCQIHHPDLKRYQLRLILEDKVTSSF